MSNWNERQERKAIANTWYLFRGSSHCSNPRLHLREGFPLSTEDAYTVYQRPEHRAPPLTRTLSKSYFHKKKKNTSNQSDHNKITKLFLKLFYNLSLFYNFAIEWVRDFWLYEV